jgi:hypothetical protein
MPTLNYINMSSSTPQNRDQQGRRGQGHNSNRKRGKDNNRSGNGGRRGSGGGDRSGGVHFSKMPRRTSKPSLWQRILGIFGLGSKPEAKPKAKPVESNKPRIRTTVTKSEKKPREPKVTRTPERVEVTSSRLYVGNLSYDASESDLMELFNGVGTVSNVEVVYNTRTQRSKGYAFLDMQSVDEAKRAVDELHDKEYMGRKMVVSGAKSPKERDVA